MLDAVDVEAMVLAQEFEGWRLGRQLELDAADLAGVLAAAVKEILDRDLRERSVLVRRQLIDRLDRIEAGEGAHEVGGVGAADLAEFREDFLRRHDRPDSRALGELGDAGRKLRFFHECRPAALGRVLR